MEWVVIPWTLDDVCELTTSALESTPAHVVSTSLLTWIVTQPEHQRICLDPFEEIAARIPIKDRRSVILQMAKIQAPCQQLFVFWYLRQLVSHDDGWTAMSGRDLLLHLSTQCAHGHRCEGCKGKKPADLVSTALSDICDFVFRARDHRAVLERLAIEDGEAHDAISVRLLACAHDIAWGKCRLATQEEADADAVDRVKLDSAWIADRLSGSPPAVLRKYRFLRAEWKEIATLLGQAE